MNTTKVLILLFGMMAVTYIPRALPAVFIDKMRFRAKMEKFLKLRYLVLMRPNKISSRVI